MSPPIDQPALVITFAVELTALRDRAFAAFALKFDDSGLNKNGLCKGHPFHCIGKYTRFDWVLGMYRLDTRLLDKSLACLSLFWCPIVLRDGTCVWRAYNTGNRCGNE